LFWLRSAAERAGWTDDDEEAEPLVEPPVPPGLGQLDPALQAFAEFFEVDEDLIAAAAEASLNVQATDEPLERWVRLLPEDERNAFLLRVARGESHVGIELLQRLRELGSPNAGSEGERHVATSRNSKRPPNTRSRCD
jgi:DNA-directed RNA polymerase specialized sigma24 family protein